MSSADILTKRDVAEIPVSKRTVERWISEITDRQRKTKPCHGRSHPNAPNAVCHPGSRGGAQITNQPAIQAHPKKWATRRASYGLAGSGHLFNQFQNYNSAINFHGGDWRLAV